MNQSTPDAMSEQSMTTDSRSEPSITPWVTRLAHVATQMQTSAESRIRTMISCDVRSGQQAIYVPPDMAQLQPRSLRYLHVFARTHNLQLVEDRRRVAVTPIHDKRNAPTSAICQAMGELLQQLGMPGSPKDQSWPHRLSSESQHVDISKLIRMAAFAAPQSKHSKVLPNPSMQEMLNDSTNAIDVFGCKLISEEISTVLGIFDSPGFRAIGYTTGKQYVLHVCLAGGEISASELWADFHTLTHTDFQLQLLEAKNPAHDIGLFYTTFYLDLSEAPAPWWLNTWAENRMALGNSGEPPMLQRAS